MYCAIIVFQKGSGYKSMICKPSEMTCLLISGRLENSLSNPWGSFLAPLYLHSWICLSMFFAVRLKKQLSDLRTIFLQYFLEKYVTQIETYDGYKDWLWVCSTWPCNGKRALGSESRFIASSTCLIVYDLCNDKDWFPHIWLLSSILLGWSTGSRIQES